MLFTKVAGALALSSVVYASEVSVKERAAANNAGNTGGNNAAASASNSGANGLTLLSNAVQQGSTNDGGSEIGAETGQALSATSNNNFINYCAGKTLTNGLQFTQGSCNGIIMGDIPAKTAMVSSIITFPTAGGTVQSDTTFNISVQMSGLVAGAFSNADSTYYAAPQQLVGGKVQGHTHVTVQDLGNTMNPKAALDPTQFAFFKGINDAGNGQGLLQAVVTNGLPAGNYRVCTMASATNHQPVLMPVAQRGSTDDCTKFQVVGNGKTANNAANDQAGGVAAAAAAAAAVSAGPDNNTSDTAVASATGKAAATGAANNGKGTATTSAAANGKGAAATGKATASTSAAANNGGNAAKGAATASSTAAKATGNAQGKAGVAGGAAKGNGATAANGANGANAANAAKGANGFNKNGRRARFMAREFIA